MMKMIIAKMKARHGNDFFVVLCAAARRVAHLIFNWPFLSFEEKVSEINRICKIVFRFDSGAWNESDAIEAWVILGAVPVAHPK